MYYSILKNHEENKYVRICLKKLRALHKYIINKSDNPRNKKYTVYGGRGVRYDPRWVNFNSFLKDICGVPGFEPLKLIKGYISLDKDLRNHKAKIYSKKLVLGFLIKRMKS